MAHTCHAKLCDVEVPPKMLMCRPHWKMVPKNLQQAVWSAYRVGQEIRKDPSREWHEAADAAINAVFRKEARKRAAKLANERQRKLF